MKSRINLPVITLAGRKNVGKSSIFNKFAGYRRSLVADYEGLTRDPVIFDTKLGEKKIRLVDLPGYFLEPKDAIETEMNLAFEEWIDKSTLVLFVVDGRTNTTKEDSEIADLIRKSGKPYLFVVNKTEHRPAYMKNLSDIYSLSMGEPVLISAEHAIGFDSLAEMISAKIPDVIEEIEVPLVKVSIVGRPNVGKSSLLNALIGENLSIVTDIPGTTRDTIDASLKYKDHEIVFMDTAGLRKRGKVEKGTVESFGGARTIRAIKNSDVCIIVTDSSEGITAQDKKIASTVVENSKASVLAMNKWDERIADFEFQVGANLGFIGYSPLVAVSAKNSWNMEGLLDCVVDAYVSYAAEVSTSEIARNAVAFSAENSMPAKTGKKLKIYYATQVRTAPPTIMIFVNFPELFSDGLKRSIVSFFRRKIPSIANSPLKIVVKARR